MTRRNRTEAADRLVARRAHAERSVRTVGYWTPELLGAALASAGALWIWPGTWPLWVVAGLLLARIPARPLLAHWHAHRATRYTTDPQLLTDHHHDHHSDRHTGGRRTDREATG